ncbi:hypothetical protein CONPUDRAFT_156080 [Coniophora puteana RWD-64-598 SS2]|uniref:Uncharacterized protein n=1 Tax=Coniophora puteana (strain RWD-64-598) TaxID=741705 RepID=A0A5M3MK20_CONPW|nr:uncharacterized protein CONPUDRAFT_156080 [Coniophora puteana RWD-64-598 SS2]EIW79403.1 hypothetical protein CONPUDRAFT_156080 [Coniophora puteana RWD-64-598 SS2]
MLRIPSGSWSNKDKDSKRSESPEMPLTPPPSGHKRERTTSTISTTSSVEGSPGRSKGLSRRSSESVKKIVKGIKRKISFHKHKHHSLNPDCSYFRDQHSRDPSTSTTDELLLTPPPFDSEHADAVARKLKARQRSISIVDHSDDDDEYPSRRDQATSIDLDPKILLPSSPVMTPVAVAPSSSSSGAASPQPPPTVDISLPVSPAPTEQPTPTTAADVNKPVPVPPVVSPAPAQSPLVNLAALTAPSMFLPIPNVRTSVSNLLTWWLAPASSSYSSTSTALSSFRTFPSFFRIHAHPHPARGTADQRRRSVSDQFSACLFPEVPVSRQLIDGGSDVSSTNSSSYDDLDGVDDLARDDPRRDATPAPAPHSSFLTPSSFLSALFAPLRARS